MIDASLVSSKGPGAKVEEGEGAVVVRIPTWASQLVPIDQGECGSACDI